MPTSLHNWGRSNFKIQQRVDSTTSSTIPFKLLLTLCIRLNYKKKISLDLSKQQNFTFKVFVYLSFAIWILKYFITKMQNWSFLNRNILGAFSSSFQTGLSKIWFTLQREKRGRTSSTASFRPIMHERSKPTSRNHDYRIICITPTECGHRGTSTAMSVHNTIEMNADFKQAEYQARATERTNERIRSESFEKVT